jgi:hypothetical protein
MRVGILSVTFLRDELIRKTAKSVLDNLPNESLLLVGDQTFKEGKLEHESLVYMELPFDFGLSASRNALVEEAKKRGLDYCVISADSILFTSKYNFEPYITFIRELNNQAVVGFELQKRRDKFVYDMELDKNKGFFNLSLPKRPAITHDGITYQPCDITKNFFIASTNLLIDNPWDSYLKLCEHEIFFYNLKLKGIKVFYTDSLCAEYIECHPPEYVTKRNRLYSEYVLKMKKKYGLNHKETCWINFIQEYRV